MNLYELQELQKAQESSMFDECRIDTYSETYDSFGDIKKVWASGIPTICGFEATGGDKKFSPETTITNIDAKIRLPIDTDISIRDRITLTKRNQVLISGIPFSIKSINKGVTCLVLDLQNLGI